jgi:hypothetical protein
MSTGTRTSAPISTEANIRARSRPGRAAGAPGSTTRSTARGSRTGIRPAPRGLVGLHPGMCSHAKPFAAAPRRAEKIFPVPGRPAPARIFRVAGTRGLWIGGRHSREEAAASSLQRSSAPPEARSAGMREGPRPVISVPAAARAYRRAEQAVPAAVSVVEEAEAGAGGDDRTR